MESYEQIRKMGEISKQLKQHGLATDSMDAQKEAEKIMGRDNEVYVSQDAINKIEEKSKSEKETEEKEKSCVNPTVVDNLNNKIASMESMMNIMREKMNEMISKMNEIEGKVNIQPRQEIQATLSAQTSSETVQEKKEAKEELIKEVKGEFTSDDVSVDKIFYAGNK